MEVFLYTYEYEDSQGDQTWGQIVRFQAANATQDTEQILSTNAVDLNEDSCSRLQLQFFTHLRFQQLWKRKRRSILIRITE